MIPTTSLAAYAARKAGNPLSPYLRLAAPHKKPKPPGNVCPAVLNNGQAAIHRLESRSRMRTSIAFSVAALAALSPLVTSADESSSFWESISENSNYADLNTVETPRMIQIEKKYGLAEPYAAKNPKTGKQTWIFTRIGPGSYYLPVVVPKDATDEQVEIACQAALAASEAVEESYVFGD